MAHYQIVNAPGMPQSDSLDIIAHFLFKVIQGKSVVARGLSIRGVWRYMAWGAVWLLIAVALLLLLFRFVNPPTSAFMVAHQLANSGQDIQHQWVPWSEISPWMPVAVIASEDQRFRDHWGVDVHAIQAAIEDFRRGSSLRGASTISQQTAKNLFLWNGRSYTRKALEAGLALGLELAWNKQRIMEVYLNIAEFGHGIYGVEAASQAFYGISARQLSPAQAARLAAILPNPKVMNAGRPSPYVWERVAWIQAQMHQISGLSYLDALH